MLRTYKLLTHLPCECNRGFENVFASRCKVVGLKLGRYAYADASLELFFYVGIGYIMCSQHRTRNSGCIREKAEQYMLAADVSMSQILGCLYRRIQGLICFSVKPVNLNITVIPF